MQNVSKELLFLLDCSQNYFNDTPHENSLDKQLNLDYLFSLALANGVLPLLKEANLPTNFEQENSIIQKRNFLMSAQLLHLVYLLKQKEIDILPIKGALLAQHAYKNISLRPFSDLDILVQIKDLHEVSLTLLSLGYQSDHPIDSIKHPYVLKKFSDISFTHSQTGVIIELHWKLIKTASSELSHIKTLFKKSHTLLLQNMELKSLPLEEEFLYLCIHAAKHRFERIEWMNDLYFLLKEHETDYDWQKLLMMAKNEKALTHYLLGLKIIESTYKKEINHAETKALLTQKKITALYTKVWDLHAQDYVLKEKKQGIRYMEIFFSIKLEESYLRKLSILKTVVFPLYIDDILSIKQLPSSLSFLYYFARLKRIFIKAL